MAFWRLSASPAEVVPWFHSRLRGRGICADCLLFTGGSPVDLPLLVVSVPPAPYAMTIAWQAGVPPTETTVGHHDNCLASRSAAH